MPTSLARTCVTLNGQMADSSTATDIYIVSPARGWIKSIHAAIGGAIGTANNAITVAIGATAQSHLAFSLVSSGSAAGSQFSVSTLRDSGAVVPGSVIKISSDGAGSNTVPTFFTIVIEGRIE